MKWEDLPVQICSIARSAAVIGDRWTLLILRDCFMGLKRFDEFQTHLGISRTVVADRLKLLTAEGVLDRTAYQQRPTRHEYHLTEKGRDLFPVLMAIIHWGDRHAPSPAGEPLLHRHSTCGHDFHPVMTCSECGDGLTVQEIHSHPREAARV